MLKLLTSILLLSLNASCFSAFAQNLMEERIRRIPPKKRSVFIAQGVFHNGGPKKKSSLKSIRHHYNKGLKRERLVIDFGTAQPPRVYGYLSQKDKKLYLDLFDTKLLTNFNSLGKSHFVKTVNLFPIQKNNVSVEIMFKNAISIDIFYLTSPGRLVLDIKK
jgi:hypothetical protein